MLVLLSKAFKNEERIPELYTCKGKEISPSLIWKNIPRDTKSFALIMDDLDTPIGILSHWILYNIPPEKNQLLEDIPHEVNLADNSIQGRNSMRRTGYMGPCPPRGEHRYVFKLYALDTVLDRNPKMDKKKLLKAIEGHILEQSEIIGVFSKN